MGKTGFKIGAIIMKRFLLLSSFLCAFGISSVATHSAHAQSQLFLGGDDRSLDDAPKSAPVFVPRTPVQRAPKAANSYISKKLKVDVPKVSTSSVASLRDTARVDAQVEAARLRLAALEKSRIAGIASKFK